jgi:hypothetical protein
LEQAESRSRARVEPAGTHQKAEAIGDYEMTWDLGEFFGLNVDV